MSINSGLDIRREIGVRDWRVTEILFVCLRNGDAFAELAAGALRCFDDCNRSVVLFDDYLQAFLADSRQDRMDIAGEFGFGKAECHLVLDHTESSTPLSCTVLQPCLPSITKEVTQPEGSFSVRLFS